MNMIVNSSDLVGYEAETKKNPKREVGNAQALNKLMKVWEGKQARSGKKVAGLGLLAVTLAACNSDDDTPFAQSDIDAAVAAVDITTDNAAAVTAALSPHASLAAAITSNDAAITTAALTASDGTIYATVDAAHTAGVNTTSADAVTAALTSADGTVHATVDAAITSNDTTISAAATTAATAAAETTLMAGTGFATVSALLAAYNTASATVSAVSATLTTGADTVNGTAANDTITGSSTTYTAGDIIVDASSTDSDVMTITATDDISAVPTIAGIESMIFNLDAVSSSGTATSFEVDTNGITSGTVTLDVTKASSTVTGVTATNVADGVTIASDLTLTSVAAEANANITVNATGTGAQTITSVSGTGDDLTIVGSGTLLTITQATAEENTTITNAGAVTITDMTAATDTASIISLTVNAGGAITITDTDNSGSMALTTTTGNIVITDSNQDTTVTATTSSGDITVTKADEAATSVTATATGDGSSTTTGADGDITLTDVGLAEAITATATGAIVVGDAEAAGTLTLSAGQASTIAATVSDVQTLNLSAVSGMDGGTTAVTFTAADGDNGTDGAGDGLVELDTINFTGSNSVTLVMSLDNFDDAEADTSNSTSAAALIATDTMTGGTSRIEFNVTAGAAVDVSSLAVDQIGVGFALGGSDAFTVASGQTFVIAADQSADLAVTAPAVAGNTLTVLVEDDANAATVTGDMAGITATNISNLTIQANDPNTTAMTTGAINVGTANTVTITGAADVNVNGAVTAGIFDSSDHTGTMTISATNATTAFTLGSGNDTLTSGGDTNLNVNGGAGADTMVLNASTNYADNTVSFTSIETLNVAASGITLAGSQVTGGSYVIVGNAGSDTLGVNATVGTGETINLSNTASTLVVVTITGGAGADSLTGSSTTATTFTGGAGSDTIVGGSAVDTVNVVLEAGAADGITLGGGSDSIVIANGSSAATISPILVTDFNAGTVATTVDTVTYDASSLQALTVLTALVDTADAATDAGAAAITILTADGTTVGTSDVVVLSQDYGTDALALAGMATAGSDTFTMGATLEDNDGILVAYSNGTHTHLAVAVMGAAGTSSNDFDSVSTFLTMQNVDATSILNAGDLVGAA